MYFNLMAFRWAKVLIKQVLFRFGIYSSSRKANINGASCYILGKISMQNCIVDVTKIKNNVFVGDVVELVQDG